MYVYNVQPGIVIDYATGENWLSGEEVPEKSEATEPDGDGDAEQTYILNTNSKKIHKSSCANADDISESNREEYTGDLEDLIVDGYTACGTCKPAA